jgi:hypothetical protein
MLALERYIRYAHRSAKPPPVEAGYSRESVVPLEEYRARYQLSSMNRTMRRSKMQMVKTNQKAFRHERTTIWLKKE